MPDDVKLVLAVAAALVWLLWAMPVVGSALFGGFDLRKLGEFTKHVGVLIAFVLVMLTSILVATRVFAGIIGGNHG